MRQQFYRWLVVNFESFVHDPSESIRTEYDGMILHIKPSNDEYCNRISTFLEPGASDRDALTKINRFLSAMAWKDNEMFTTRGSNTSNASLTDREHPRFNYREKKRYPYGVISNFDFEHLQIVRRPDQQLALALYREGLGADNGFYQFLSFYKVVNIFRASVAQQSTWINENLQHVWDYAGVERFRKLVKDEIDIGAYLSKQGRCAIAHAYEQPIRDPDLPDDIYEIREDIGLMKGLAQVAIEMELGVSSMRKIWSEHLYELAGFREFFGQAISFRLQDGESVPLAQLPQMLTLSLRLRGHSQLNGLKALPMTVISSKDGVLVIGSHPSQHSVHLLLRLDFPQRSIDLLLNAIGVDRTHAEYSKEKEADLNRFLKNFFANGALEIYDESENRLSFKTPSFR